MNQQSRKTNIKILIACHKEDSAILQDDIYMPIQVGKALHPELDLGFQCDNTGDNISEKNESYCELTAIYWAWKNLKDVDYIGLCHYRRYFDFKNSLLPFEDYRSIKVTEFLEKDLGEQEICMTLNKYDVIIPKEYNTPFSLDVEYGYYHIINDLKILREAINEIHPDYLGVFDDFMLRNNKLSPYNMFVMPFRIFNDYCEWLFSILFLTEKKILISSYKDQARVFGYMAERLLNIYLIKNKYSLKKYPVLKVDNANPIKYYKKILGRIRNNISASINYKR